MEIKNRPKRGWHWSHCFLCGEQVGKVVHYGGKKKLKKCKWCQDSGMKVCIDCFSDK